MIYLITSVALAIVFAVAFGGVMGLIFAFIVGFWCTFSLMASVDTFVTGNNRGVDWAKNTLLLGLRNLYKGWYFLLVPLSAVVLVVCGFLLAPLWFLLQYFYNLGSRVDNIAAQAGAKIISFFDTVWYVPYILGICVLAGLSIFTFAAPAQIYRHMHWGWWIAIISLLCILLVVVVGIRRSDRYIKSGRATFALCLLSLAAIPVVALAIHSSTNEIYYISDRGDMRIFGNAPQNQDTVFVLENDIDFGGKRVRWFGKYTEFKGVFDGKGYTLSNFKVKKNAVSTNSSYTDGTEGLSLPHALGLVVRNHGVLRNLNISDAKITMGYNSLMPNVCYGTLAGINASGGSVVDCSVVDCIATYVKPKRDTIRAFMTVGKNVGEVRVTESYSPDYKPDASFVQEGWVLVPQISGTTE